MTTDPVEDWEAPCPHCSAFLVRYEDDEGDEREVCPACHLTPDGDLDLPREREDERSVGDLPYSYPRDSYDRYRKSSRTILRGVYPAIESEEDRSFGTDDGSSDTDTLVSV